MSNEVAAPSTCAPTPAVPPLDAGEAAEIARGLKALADPVRLQLVSLIGAHVGAEACVCDLTGAFDLTAPTISHHLKVLREAGILTAERRGTWVHYRIEPDALAAVVADVTLLSSAGSRHLVSAAPA